MYRFRRSRRQRSDLSDQSQGEISAKNHELTIVDERTPKKMKISRGSDEENDVIFSHQGKKDAIWCFKLDEEELDVVKTLVNKYPFILVFP